MPAAASLQRATYKAPEVCEIAGVPHYVLRSWEVEFPDLGISKTADGPRVYRKADVDLVLKIKHLMMDEGLTLAGARKQLVQEGATAEPMAVESEEVTDADVAAVVDRRTIRSLHEVRDGLGWILNLLGGEDVPPTSRARVTKALPARAARSTRNGKPVRSSVKRKAAKPAKRRKR
jgi:DNA-binding transcriptional MerR regulator